MKRGVAAVCAGADNADVKIIGASATIGIGKIYGVCRCAMTVSTKWSDNRTHFVVEVYRVVTD